MSNTPRVKRSPIVLMARWVLGLLMVACAAGVALGAVKGDEADRLLGGGVAVAMLAFFFALTFVRRVGIKL